MLSRRRLAVGAAILITAAGGALLVRRWIYSTAFPESKLTLIRGMPYTAMRITVAQGKDGRRRVTEQRIEAVRGDGAVVWLGYHPAQPALGPVRRIIRADGRATLAIEKLSVRLTQSLPVEIVEAGPAARLFRAPGCVSAGESSLGGDVVAGVAVRVARQETAQRIRTTFWRAPDYACLAMALAHEIWAEGRWQPYASQRTVWFRPGEPDPQFFDEGWIARMKEMSPAQLVRRIAEAAGADPADCPACYNPAAIEEWDRQYYRNQSPPRGGAGALP